MKRLTLALIAGTLALAPLMTFAQNDDKWQQMAELDDGIQNIKRDNSGQISSLLVIGKGKVSRAFSKQKAKQIAGREASRNARNAFAQFLNTHVTWAETSAGEVVLKEKGAASGDDGAAVSVQEGVSTEVTSEKSSQYSSAALSGLRQVWSGYDKDGMRVIIFGWKLSDCQAIGKLSRTMGKSARASVNQAKALEGAHRQDPDRAYRKAERRSAANSGSSVNNSDNGAQQVAPYGNNAAPARTSAASPDADDFF